MYSARIVFCVLLMLVSSGYCYGARAVAPVQVDGFALYVAPDGNDSWSGNLPSPKADGTDGPFATIAGARDAIREMKRRDGIMKPITVFVREGTYRVAEPIVFTPQDSGTEQHPITYAAYPGDKPIVSGGRVITGWRKKGDLWAVELPDVKSGDWHFGALWVNGERRVVARTPNDGYLYTAGKASPVKEPETGEEVSREKVAFKFKPGDIKPWEDLNDILVVAYHSWETSTHRIASVDAENNIVTFTGPAVWPFEQWGKNQRYHIENLRDALDAPGEWYLDRKTGMLSYWPKDGEDMSRAEVVAPVATQLVLLQGDPKDEEFVEHLHIKGIRFMHSDWPIPPQGHSDPQAAFSVPGALHAVGARYCSVEGCEISRVGTYGVWFSLGCKHNRIVQNEIHDLGAGGVRIGEGRSPENEPEAASHNLIDNNFIHDGGKIFRAGVGVWIGRSSYNTVSHNEVCDLDYSGLSIGWCWGYAPSTANNNVIEHNHVHHIGRGVLSDMGGIYTLGISPGTVIRYNIFHDIYSFSYGGWGIYPDEGSTEILIENNIAYNTKTGGFHQHYGRENIVRNNIFAFSREGQIIRSREEEHISFFFERNIVYFNNGQLLGSNWKNGNYRLDYNCYWDTSRPEVEFKGMSFEEWQAKGQDKHSIIADPLFVNAEEFDFRLNADSPALKLGFKPIDMTKNGLYGPPEWVAAPTKIKR